MEATDGKATVDAQGGHIAVKRGKVQSALKLGRSLTWCFLASVDDFKTIQPST